MEKIPSWVTSDMLTALGFTGSAITCASLASAHYVSRYYLLFSILGLFINWFGDSLDGRLAFYRNKPRKWYGFTLDLIVDWLGTVLIGLGFVIYMDSFWKLAGYGFVAFYGWSMIIAIDRYKITGKYSIDSGLFGPTEVRIFIGTLIILETFLPGSLKVTSLCACVALFVFNIIDTKKLLRIADLRDHQERLEKEAADKNIN
ncbi:MAG: CDP-alcohol phosphatidyltransferase [Paludibacteraceae bacterium]